MPTQYFIMIERRKLDNKIGNIYNVQMEATMVMQNYKLNM